MQSASRTQPELHDYWLKGHLSDLGWGLMLGGAVCALNAKKKWIPDLAVYCSIGVWGLQDIIEEAFYRLWNVSLWRKYKETMCLGFC